MYKKLSLLFLVIFLGHNAIQAQSFIKGQVISQQDKEPLPYATVVSSNGEFAFTNDNGQFRIKGKNGDILSFSFLGYRDTTVIDFKSGSIVELFNDGFLTDEILITDTYYTSPYDIVKRARKAYFKENSDEIRSKVFVKRASENNELWSDQTESLYTFVQKHDRIFDFIFKHGKSYINQSNDMIFTLDLLEVLKVDWIFDKKPEILYPSIFSHSKSKKMKKQFKASYSIFETNDRAYYKIISKAKGDNLFSSEITIDTLTYDIKEVVNRIENPKRVAFKSVTSGKAVSMDYMEFTYKFEQKNDRTLLTHIDVTYQYSLENVVSKNELAFHFYDYGNQFFINETEIDYSVLSDYDKIWFTPYSGRFWKDQNIAESKMDTLSDMASLSKSIKSRLLVKKHLTRSELDTIGLDALIHVPKTDDGKSITLEILFDFIQTKLHLNAHYFVNPYLYNGKLKAEVVPLINFDRSFIYDTPPLLVSYFHQEMDVMDKTGKELQEEIDGLDLPIEEKQAEIKNLTSKYNNKLWRQLSKMDDLQFYNWTGYDPLGKKKQKGSFRMKY